MRRDDAALVDAVLQLRESVGEFEKPKFFQYRQKICAHSRNEQIGCSACIEVCSAEAIRSDASLKGRTAGGGIVVEPHLCVGCGACTTVCPSGALSYATPRPEEMGLRIRTAAVHLCARRRPRRRAARAQPGRRAPAPLRRLGRAARTDRAVRGLPARVLPLEVWHTASVGLDLWLAAVAQGAVQVWVLMTDEEAPAYRAAVAAQMAVAEAILAGLGFGGEHFRIVDAATVGPRAARSARAARRRRSPASRCRAAAPILRWPVSTATCRRPPRPA